MAQFPSLAVAVPAWQHSNKTKTSLSACSSTFCIPLHCTVGILGINYVASWKAEFGQLYLVELQSKACTSECKKKRSHPVHARSRS